MAAGLRLRLEIEDTGHTVRKVKEMGYRAEEARPVLRMIKHLMEVGAEEQFVSEGARSSEHWKQDLPATVQQKLAEGADARTEIRTGDLARSILGGGDNNTIHRLTKQSTTFGTKVFYSVYQGHTRRLLALTRSDADRWSELMVRYILTGETHV